MSRRVFRSRGQMFELVPAGSPRAVFIGAAEASALLTPLLADPLDVQRLRSIAGELAPGTSSRDDRDVLARLVSAFASGRLALTRLDEPARPPLHLGTAGRRDRPSDEPDAFDLLQKATIETHWIEIQLIGEDGVGIVGQRYLIVTPDGRERRGLTDSLGTARVTRIPVGTCKVSFPDLDEGAWETVSASGE